MSLNNQAADGLSKTSRSRQAEYERRGSLERQGSFDDALGASINSLNGWQDAVDTSVRPEGSPVSEDASAKKKKGKKPFRVFRRKNKKKSLAGDTPTQGDMLSVPLDASLRRVSSNTSVNSMDSEASFEQYCSDQELTETLMNPSMIHRRESGRGDAVSLAPDDEPGSQEGHASSLDHQMSTPDQTSYIVHVTLESGHSLAVRDKTGTSDPYVKFKCETFRYRSNTIYRDLDPKWNEKFDFQISHLKQPLRVKVYDHDRGSLDDFMGGATVNMGLYTDGNVHIVDLGLEDPHAKEEYLGYIRVFIQVVAQSQGSSHASLSSQEIRQLRVRRSTQLWRSVLTVTLLEGCNLPPMDDNGLSDPYCKFKLGRQKYKSKVRPKTLNPQWKERFEMRMYDNEPNTLHIEVWDRDYAHSDDFIGHCCVVLNNHKSETTHSLTLPLKHPKGEEAAGSIKLLLSISGTSTLPEELTKCKGRGTNEVNMVKARKQYGVLRSLDMSAMLKREVGFLRVKIGRAVQLPALSGGTCNSFVMLEVGNAAVRTKTVYRNVNPEWEKVFYFNVKDIHNELEVSLHNEVPGKAGKTQFVGRVKIPLLRTEYGVSRPYCLKDKDCLHRAQGVVYLQCDLVYNALRAAVRTVNPREDKVLEEEEKFERKVLTKNIKRVVAMTKVIGPMIAVYNRIFAWENKWESLAAFLVFVIVCLFVELWMLFLLGGVVFLIQLLLIRIRGRNSWETKYGVSQAGDPSESDEFSSLSDFEDDVEQSSKTGIRHKFRQFQEILLYVQSYAGYVADLGERARNLFDWNVPFLCWLAVIFLFGGAMLLYYVPLRYLILVWGINKFTKRLRNPGYISNIEILDYLSRSPTDRQLMQWKELSASRQKAVKAKTN